MCEGRGRTPSKETVSLWIERDLWRKVGEPGNAFLVECHPSAVETLIGFDGENVEDLEHQMRRGIFIRANFDMQHEEYEIRSGSIDEFEREWMGYRRAQVLEVNVRRSAFENSTRTVGWTDDGYFVELIDGGEFIGHRAKVTLLDIRRSYGVAEVIVPGSAVINRSLS